MIFTFGIVSGVVTVMFSYVWNIIEINVFGSANG